MKNYYYKACGNNVFKVTFDGAWMLYKTFASEQAARNWVARH